MSFINRVMALVKSGNIPIRHGAQQQSIRKAGQVARDVLIKTASQVHVGATTAEIDRIAAAAARASATEQSIQKRRGGGTRAHTSHTRTCCCSPKLIFFCFPL